MRLGKLAHIDGYWVCVVEAFCVITKSEIFCQEASAGLFKPDSIQFKPDLHLCSYVQTQLPQELTTL